jgi:hypothetical protein
MTPSSQYDQLIEAYISGPAWWITVLQVVGILVTLSCVVCLWLITLKLYRKNVREFFDTKSPYEKWREKPGFYLNRKDRKSESSKDP